MTDKYDCGCDFWIIKSPREDSIMRHPQIKCLTLCDTHRGAWYDVMYAATQKFIDEVVRD